MSDELKAIEALANALGFDLVKKVDRYEVHNSFAGAKDVESDIKTGKCYRFRTWYECNKKEVDEEER